MPYLGVKIFLNSCLENTRFSSFLLEIVPPVSVNNGFCGYRLELVLDFHASIYCFNLIDVKFKHYRKTTLLGALVGCDRQSCCIVYYRHEHLIVHHL